VTSSLAAFAFAFSRVPRGSVNALSSDVLSMFLVLLRGSSLICADLVIPAVHLRDFPVFDSMTDRAEPANIKRLRIVVVMGLN
jgi:hypothetical protein